MFIQNWSNFKSLFLQFQNSYYQYLQNTRTQDIELNYFLQDFSWNIFYLKNNTRVKFEPLHFYAEQRRENTQDIRQVNGNCCMSATFVFWAHLRFHSWPNWNFESRGPKHSQHMLRTPSFSLVSIYHGFCFNTS